MRDANHSDSTPAAGPAPGPGPGGNGPARLDAGALIRTLAQHRRQRGHTAAYWNEYSLLIRLLCRAAAVLVAGRDETRGWTVLGSHCPDGWLAAAWHQHVDELNERARHNGFAFCPVLDGARQQRILAVVRTSGAGEAVVLMDVPERERANLNELVMRALLASDFAAPAEAAPAAATAAAAANDPVQAPATAGAPAAPVVALSASGVPTAGLPAIAAPAADPSGAAAAPLATPAPADGELVALLELAAQVMGQPRFAAAAMTLVNGVAAHFRAAQAALGWIDAGAVKVAAVSHLDRFEHNTENVRLLEQLFTACLGQPRPDWYVADAGTADDAVPAHSGGADDADADSPAYAAARLRAGTGYGAQCVLPVADADGRVRAILYLGFAAREPDRGGIAPLQLMLGFVQPWLQAVREQERGAGWRLARSLRGAGERFMGPDFAWGRVAAALAGIVLLGALLGSWDYHVEASSQLTTDSSRIISAQFDSRVETVMASAGDLVKQGAPLATLDTRELRQQESDVRAESQRLAAESDKARAAGNLAEMEIARARLAQAEARLARVLHYLEQARTVAPFDGVVVEGERKELMNAPVKKGDRLFKVARIDGLYVEMMVPEREIRYVQPGAEGVLRLVARPDLEIPFKLATIIPMAQVKGQEGNHFLIKAKLGQAPEAWWRPGMSGMARIDAGRQNILWIWTHRFTDNLRMKLWWLGW